MKVSVVTRDRSTMQTIPGGAVPFVRSLGMSGLAAAGMFILWLAMAVSVWSGVDYYVRVVKALTPKPIATGGKRAVI